MKLKILTLTCAVGLFALGTGIKAADVPVAGCESECAKGVVKCKVCAFEKKASSTASSKLSSTTSNKSSNTASSGTSKTSPGTPSGKVVESDTGVSDLTTTMNTKGAPYLCSKGSLLTNKVTLRSGNGLLCKNSVVAAFAKLHCVGQGDFDTSQCATKYMDAAIAKAGGNPQAILDEAAEKGTGAIKAFAARFKSTNANAD